MIYGKNYIGFFQYILSFARFNALKLLDMFTAAVQVSRDTAHQFNETWLGLLCRSTTSFVLFQNWQYITKNVILRLSVFHGPSSQPWRPTSTVFCDYNT